MDAQNVSQPSVPDRQKRGPWKQILIVFVSAAVLGASSCAVMATTWSKSNVLFMIATLIFFAAVATIPVLIVWTIVALILKVARKRRSQA